jgi:hypothetical protein
MTRGGGREEDARDKRRAPAAEAGALSDVRSVSGGQLYHSR